LLAMPPMQQQTTGTGMGGKEGSKAKGFFKTPSYPQEVLRPRAHVVAPTPWTAASAPPTSEAASDQAFATTSACGCCATR
jgi:SWI/SNF-related matrix-associated actin-dependent regulator of chromatin subfamily B protein 1